MTDQEKAKHASDILHAYFKGDQIELNVSAETQSANWIVWKKGFSQLCSHLSVYCEDFRIKQK